jgi:hypothetical protein
VTTPADIVNRALSENAGQATVTGTPPTFDGSAAGLAAGVLYTPTVLTVLRQQDWEFSRRTAVLVLTGNPATAAGQYEYAYPADCVKVRQLLPQTWDINDPPPVRWSVSFDEVSATPSRVIWSNLQSANIVYTSSTVTENQWDSVFAESVVRLLGSVLAMAIAGRPEAAREMLQQYGQFGQSGQGLDS